MRNLPPRNSAISLYHRSPKKSSHFFLIFLSALCDAIHDDCEIPKRPVFPAVHRWLLDGELAAQPLDTANIRRDLKALQHTAVLLGELIQGTVHTPHAVLCQALRLFQPLSLQDVVDERIVSAV